MKTLNYIAQIVVAVLYSSIFAGISIALNFIPVWLFFKLSLFWFIVIFIFFDAIIYGIVGLVHGIVALPYMWINKNNSVARIISVVSIVVVGIRALIYLWTMDANYDWKLIILAVILTVQIIYTMYSSSIISIGISEES